MSYVSPIDPNITPQAAAFHKQLYNLWHAGKHVSAAWISIDDTANVAGYQPEWNMYKLGTGQTPAMVCLNGEVTYLLNTPTRTIFGIPTYATPGCMPFVKRVAAHGGLFRLRGQDGATGVRRSMPLELSTPEDRPRQWLHLMLLGQSAPRPPTFPREVVRACWCVQMGFTLLPTADSVVPI